MNPHTGWCRSQDIWNTLRLVKQPRTEAIMETTTIYMDLPDEAVDVWRPVRAEDLGEGHYRVLGPVPADEIWEFQSGLVVRAQMERLSGGDKLVAFTNATN